MLLTLPGISQRILVVENIKSMRNIKYYPGDIIMLKVENKSNRVIDEIYDMTDSSISLTLMGEVKLDKITGIYRESWLVQTTRGLSFLAGVGYFGIDSFNRLINNDSPVILVETAVISAGFIALAAALTPLRYRKYNTTGNWGLRTINLDSF
jgi:hypothetical protein